MPFLGVNAIEQIGALLEELRTGLAAALEESATAMPVAPPAARRGSINVNAILGGQGGDRRFRVSGRTPQDPSSPHPASDSSLGRAMAKRTWLPAAIVQVIDRVEARLEEPWLLEAMADEACFSAFHFHRLFLEATGERPAAFVERLRLERAALMLLASEEPITELAMDVGFRRPETFARRFRNRFDTSARDYRRRQIELWSELGLDAGEDPLGEPGDIAVTRLPESIIEVRRSVGEDEGFTFDPADAPWSEWECAGANRIGATLDWPGITPPGRVRQDWGRCLGGRRLSEGWVRRTIGGGLYATLPAEGTGPVSPTVYQRLLVWSMAGRYRLPPGPILEVQQETR